MPKPSGSGASASSSSPARWTGRGGTGPSTSSIQTGSWSSWPRRSPAPASPWLTSTNGPRSSPTTRPRSTHRSASGPARIPLTGTTGPFPSRSIRTSRGSPCRRTCPALDVPALEAIGVTSVPDPTPGPDVAALARLLVLGAGVHHTKTFRDGEVLYFRNYASAGALYPVEVYVGCADLPGLPAGVYHFDPQGPTLTRLREGDHRGHLVRAAAGEPAVARAPVSARPHRHPLADRVEVHRARVPPSVLGRRHDPGERPGPGSLGPPPGPRGPGVRRRRGLRAARAGGAARVPALPGPDRRIGLRDPTRRGVARGGLVQGPAVLAD